MQISVRQIMGRARPICFLNLKLRWKNAVKQRDGFSYYTIPTPLRRIPLKPVEIYAVAYGGFWSQAARPWRKAWDKAFLECPLRCDEIQFLRNWWYARESPDGGKARDRNSVGGLLFLYFTQWLPPVTARFKNPLVFKNENLNVNGNVNGNGNGNGNGNVNGNGNGNENGNGR